MKLTDSMNVFNPDSIRTAKDRHTIFVMNSEIKVKKDITAWSE